VRGAPPGLPHLWGRGPAPNGPVLLPEETVVAAIVVGAWLVALTAIGAWRMRTRDA
jgi:hypothetical protein